MTERQRDSDIESEFERRTKRAFDRSVREVDSATRSRLAQARRNAVEGSDDRAARRGWTWSLAPAGAIAASVLAVAVLLWQNGSRTELPVADLEILLAEDDLDIEMLDEEIEFYAWLEEQPELAAPAAVGDGVG